MQYSSISEHTIQIQDRLVLNFKHKLPTKTLDTRRLEEHHTNSSKCWKFTGHRGDEGPGEEWIPSGCYSLPVCAHPRAAYLQRSASVGLVGFPPCPVSLPSHCR
ncbi:unnamed protein product [Musa hybrid cultivar]